MKRLLSLVAVFCALMAGSRLARAEDISGSGWRLWPDRDAAWQNDDIYLPADVNLAKLPVNPPTGGWQVLNDQQGIAVTLPSTVEEHYWGKLGTRPYNHHEAQRGAGTSFPNGNYLGVSWWWRDVSVPQFKSGQRVIVSFRGARLRAEVYCNGKLCGYNIMTELPFQADITDAVKPGQTAHLAVRITNPGGHLDWIDFAGMQIQWGKYTLPPSHGFGGLDSDIDLSIRDNASVSDLAAINRPDLHEVTLEAEVTSVSKKYSGPVEFQITKDGKTVWSTSASVNVPAGGKKTVSVLARIDSAEPWDLDHPNLYRAKAILKKLPDSGRGVDFGFRYFTAVGIGTNGAKLTLNGKRIVPRSAISWGYWGRNGLWPDQEMAEREVSDAKELGLTCLQFHRNIGKPAVLDLQDRMGLLRDEEPGGGKFAFGARYSEGPWGDNDEFVLKGEETRSSLAPKKDYKEPDSVDTSGAGPDGDGRAFWEKYEEEKIIEMVKRDRSHPSLIMYTIQNESNEIDLRNPRIYRIFREMHALDPSRTIVAFSGGVPKESQVFMAPYSDDISYGGKKIPFAGWKDVHTCGGPCNYMDSLYTDPTHFTQRQKESDSKEICMWGETLGAATPDDYDHLVHSFDEAHPTGYELDDMTKVLAGYHAFLDKWGFRQAFPTDSDLFQAIGYRMYYFWQRIVEQTRMDDINDYLVISGWESTTIDNHSGLVDNHRFFKGDPKVLAKACQPEMLVIQPRHMIVARGHTDIVDVFLINENNLTGVGELTLTAKNPDGSILLTTNVSVTVRGGDVYGQLLAEGIELPPTGQAGMVTLQALFTQAGMDSKAVAGDDQLEVIDVAGTPIFQNVAVAEQNREVTDTLQNVFNVTAVPFSDVPASNHLDAIILAPKSADRDLRPASDPKAGPVTKEIFKQALDRVHDDGTRLVLWADNNFAAEAFARELGSQWIVKNHGPVGNLNAPWFGSWFFVRKHWLLDGLPADCAMDWRYGISAFCGPEWTKENPRGSVTDGFMLDAPGMEVAVGYGADHNTNVGISACVIPYGKGQILFYSLPQLVQSLQPGRYAISPVIAQRLLGNALRPQAGTQAKNDN